MKQTIESFIERVKVESNIHKFIQEALIYKLITNFRKNYVKMNYPKKINNPLDIVLKFYKNYNKEYYDVMITDKGTYYELEIDAIGDFSNVNLNDRCNDLEATCMGNTIIGKINKE